MILTPAAVALLVINLGLIWLLLAAPIGARTIRICRRFDAAPERIWKMVYPLGEEANWSPSVISSHAGHKKGQVVQALSHADRLGNPIQRVLEVRDDHANGALAYHARITDDSALHPSFWSSFRERRTVSEVQGGCELLVEIDDHYRGVAFFMFRYFMLRREMKQLQTWLQSGHVEKGGMFEHPLTQAGLALLSTLLLWPFFGLTMPGLFLSSLVTLVIVLHELGHMAAYRAFGHKRVRMIFIPLLGGMAVGSRPYKTLFEVAACALLGAGFSAFLAPILIGLHGAASASSAYIGWQSPILIFMLVLGAFNFLNLLPMSRFDGGQVLAQVFPTRDGLMGASFLVTAAILWTCWRIGLPQEALFGGLAVMALMSFAGGQHVRPRDVLDDMSPMERMQIGLGYYAVLAIHANALIYAADRLFV